jgi:alkylmercury lyase
VKASKVGSAEEEGSRVTRPEDETQALSTCGGSPAHEALADFLRDGRMFHRSGPAAQRVQLALYRLIAAGAPVALDRLARAAGLDEGEIAEILGAIPPSNFQRDEAGRILGFRGLGQVPSRHRLRLVDPALARAALYAWCALDCLFLPVLLGGAIGVASRCPVTDTAIRLTVTPTGVQDVRPETTVMSFVTPEAARLRADLRGSFCCHVNFFASGQAAEAWRADNQGAAILSLDQGFDLGRIRNEAGFGEVL